MLSKAAGNALLKTLEEPRGDTLLVLLSSQPNRLLETIRSRCQKLPFNRHPLEMIQNELEQQLDLDPEKVNVNGGAIAMGHPLGATGAMILGTVLDELERRDLNTAVATLCIGAGMGTATVIERV